MNRSSGEGDITDLKSALFLEILGDGGRVTAQIWNSSAWIRISITWVDAEWLLHFQKQVIIEILSNIDETVTFSNFSQVSGFFQTFMASSDVLFFTGKDDGPTIEEFIKDRKHIFKTDWRGKVWLFLIDEAAKWWWNSLDHKQLTKLSDEEFEKLLLDRWSHARKQDKEKHVGLFPTGISLLQVHGLIQKEKIIVSINPSCKHSFINVNLAKKIANSSKTH